MSLCTCGIQTTEDDENPEIAKSMWVGDQKQKYDLEWPNVACKKSEKAVREGLEMRLQLCMVPAT